MHLQFIGAVRSVTGSLHVLEANGHRVLLECGLFQGRRAEARERNRKIPLDVSKLDVVSLSHAHIDHSGNLPNLMKAGYKGRIKATAATVDLTRILLLDSAFLQEKDAEYLNRHERTHRVPVEPIYTREDAEEANTHFDAVPYHHPLELAPGIRATYYDAGHILGSAATLFEVEEGARKVRIGFTGDLGRPRTPILRDPQPLPALDYLIIESTYGNRVHDATESLKQKLLELVRSTFARGGRLIIPAFSVGRTQNLVYYLAQLFQEGALPRVKIYVDSPLAIDATHAYRDHPECYDAETLHMLEQGTQVFGFDWLSYTRSVEESKALNTLKGPAVVIAASGMCEGGRILHHLKNGIGNPANTVLIVGFQAEHTLGRRLVEKAEVVKIYGEAYEVRAQVAKINGFSAHADRDELATYAKHIPGLKQVFIVHGEEQASLGLAAYLDQIKIKAHVPKPGEVVEL
jgi:metallo-beta-lactamase family protein